MNLQRALIGFLVLAIAAFAGSCSREQLKHLVRNEVKLNLRTVDGENALIGENQLKYSLNNFSDLNKDEIVNMFDVAGAEVHIEKSEIEQAIALLLHSKKKIFSELFINGDASVTILAPRFLYRGVESVVIVAGAEDPLPSSSVSPPRRQESLLGLCRYFGFARFLAREEYATNNLYRTVNEARGSAASVLTISGEIAKFFENAYSASYKNDRRFISYYNVVHAVTCTEKQD